MFSIKSTWSALKEKELPMSYIEANGNYYIYSNSSTSQYICVVDVSSSDGEDFNTNFKSGAEAL